MRAGPSAASVSRRSAGTDTRSAWPASSTTDSSASLATRSDADLIAIGQAAADAYCKSQNFASAAAFDYDNDVGAQSPTLVLGDNKVCAAAACDAFKTIRCQ